MGAPLALELATVCPRATCAGEPRRAGGQPTGPGRGSAPLHIHAIISADGLHILAAHSRCSGDQIADRTSEPLSPPASTVFDTQLHEKLQEFKALGLAAPATR
ncbi:hypothetical protein OHT76_38090 [Streptomyces sp. NBC_00287]|uniref:hypothetical protein n=1 Tax=Streptomyces sp. NBC_00287 TaxID=2975702 RepID=UPI002E2B5B24|nr:hypothetical protein [Streptomyces sp. NBC_00287]